MFIVTEYAALMACDKKTRARFLAALTIKYRNGNRCTVKPVLSSHLKRRPKLFIKTDYRLMQVKSIAEHSAILSTIIKLPIVIKIVVLSILERPLKTGFTE